MTLFIVNNATKKGADIMKKYTDFLLTVIMILGITVILAAMPTEREVSIYEDTLRLHILANSDNEEDQRVKYEIRDRLLKKYGNILKESNSPKEAKEGVDDLKDDIERDVQIWLSENGFDYGCDVEVGVEWYDTREYEDFTLPKGYYTSLRVMLGEAEGRNWWCVMYPPLCLDIATEEKSGADQGGYTDEEYALITKDGYNVKFKILEVLSEAFSKKG